MAGASCSFEWSILQEVYKDSCYLWEVTGEDVSNSQLHLHFFVFSLCFLSFEMLPKDFASCFRTSPAALSAAFLHCNVAWLSAGGPCTGGGFPPESCQIRPYLFKNLLGYQKTIENIIPSTSCGPQKRNLLLVAWKYHEVSILKQSYMNL